MDNNQGWEERLKSLLSAGFGHLELHDFIAAELAKKDEGIERAREEGYDKGADEWAESMRIAVAKEKTQALWRNTLFLEKSSPSSPLTKIS